jgi:uncharacterized membrane protein YfcA
MENFNYLQAYLIILPSIFFAGFVDAIAGGGGILSVPAYMAAGLPPHYVLGNNKFSSAFGTLFTTLRYFKHGMIDLKVAVISAIGALVGSFLGSKTILILDPSVVRYLLVVMLPIIAFISIFNKNLGHIDTSHEHPSKRKFLIGIIIGLVMGFYDGFFGPGTGLFIILAYTLLIKYDFVVANANTKVVNLASNIAALITFLINGKVMFSIGIPAVICGIAGNYVGSKMVVKKGVKIIRPILIMVLIALFLKIIVDLF